MRVAPVALDELRGYLQAQPVTFETLPPEIAREWVTKDSRYKVEVTLTIRADNETLREFARGAGGRAERHRRADLDSRSGRTVILRSSRPASGRSLDPRSCRIVLRRFGDVCSPSFRCSWRAS